MTIEEQCKTAALQVIELGKLTKGDILVVGCSTSEVLGSKIGTESSPETAEEIYKGLTEACDKNGVFLALQCCEHLNRAIVIEKIAAKEAERVNVVPQPKAGGSLASVAYKKMVSPLVVEHIKADAGLDIGDTLIGMHLKEVAVPLRLDIKKIGEAHLVAARVRPKFIGGARAVYDEDLL